MTILDTVKIKNMLDDLVNANAILSLKFFGLWCLDKYSILLI